MSFKRGKYCLLSLVTLIYVTHSPDLALNNIWQFLILKLTTHI